MVAGAGIQFDPALTEVFVQMLLEEQLERQRSAAQELEVEGAAAPGLGAVGPLRPAAWLRGQQTLAELDELTLLSGQHRIAHPRDASDPGQTLGMLLLAAAIRQAGTTHGSRVREALENSAR